VKLTIQRDAPTAKSTSGKLSIDGVFFSYTLEPVRRIPAGTYAATLAVSPKWTALRGYPFRVPLLQNVPGFTEIEIHIGNFPEDTEGCTLVGMERGADEVMSSELAFFPLFHRLPQGFGVEYLEAV
jgi:hypothetical protein